MHLTSHGTHVAGTIAAIGANSYGVKGIAHPTILAYAMDEAVLDTSGEIVNNIKGAVTFGPQSIKECNISVTKNIFVKDMKGIGGNCNVAVDKSSFTLNGEQLLKVTLTAKVLKFHYHSQGTSAERRLLRSKISQSETDLSFNNDGIKDSAVLPYKLLGKAATIFVKVEAASVPEAQKYIVSETDNAGYVNESSLQYLQMKKKSRLNSIQQA